jgi:hypothetical protein
MEREQARLPSVGRGVMSETLEIEAINQALEMIDKSLGVMHTRELVSTTEVSDLLLDMRSILASAGIDLEAMPEVVPSPN